MSEYYDREGFDESIDVSASNRKFQTSIIVKQDPGKSGILAFLSSVEESRPSQPTSTPPQTIRPSGEY